VILVRIIAVLAVALVLVACSTVGIAGASSPTAAPASLEGRTFLSTKVDGRDLVADTQVRLTFNEGQLAIHAGCNSMSGAYQVTEGHLVLGNMATTEMGCDAALMDQDQWVATFLGGAAADLAGDTLTLRNGDVVMTLTDREVADPDRPLEGTRWTLDGIIAGDATSSVPGGVVAGMTIANEQIQVETGCNTGSGPVTVTPTQITIGPLALTKRACQRDAAAVEAAMTSVLTGEVAYAIEADRLTVTTGRSGLTFRAAS